MSDEGRDRLEIPKEMRSMAQASFDQARKAFEKFLASAQQTAGSIEERGATVRAGAKDISTKAISNAEKNVQASLDFAEKLLHAKDLTEVMRLHSEYVQAQMRTLAEQASEMGQIVSRAATPSTGGGVLPEPESASMRFATGPGVRASEPHFVRVWHAASHLKLHCVAQN